jgi:hypothetical protein
MQEDGIDRSIDHFGKQKKRGVDRASNEPQRTRNIILWRKKRGKNTTSTAGFEPAQAKPNRFRVCLLNHSDISTLLTTKAKLLYL